MQIKCFSKCPCFKKRPLPWKIHGYATARSRSFLELPNRIELLKTLLKIQEFSAREFLQNCYCLDLLKVCEIFFVFDLVIFSITVQKNITCQKWTKDKIILLNGIIWYPLFWWTCIRMNHTFILPYVTCIVLRTCINYCNDVLELM